MAVQVSGGDTLHSNAALRNGTGLRLCTPGASVEAHCHIVELLEAVSLSLRNQHQLA